MIPGSHNWRERETSPSYVITTTTTGDAKMQQVSPHCCVILVHTGSQNLMGTFKDGNLVKCGAMFVFFVQTFQSCIHIRNVGGKKASVTSFVKARLGGEPKNAFPHTIYYNYGKITLRGVFKYRVYRQNKKVRLGQSNRHANFL